MTATRAAHPGLVSLVGAGPGDPELLTIRALRTLQQAELVLYDALVSAEVLALAPQARRIAVGKRAGGAGVGQGTINRLMCRMALRGQRIVRLKCGDPFVLGRGGEEALALAAAGVRVEIVPGLSSAVAAPALAGIPVTHRGLASGFAVVSGHAEATFAPIVDSIAPGSMTIVVLMGVAARASLARRLIARGWNPQTPAAVLLAASTARSRSWIGPLRGLPDAPIDGSPPEPGTIVIGRVVDVGRLLGMEEGLVRTTEIRAMEAGDRRAARRGVDGGGASRPGADERAERRATA